MKSDKTGFCPGAQGTSPISENVRRNGEYNEDYFITG